MLTGASRRRSSVFRQTRARAWAHMMDGMSASVPLHPGPSQSRRGRVLVVAVVGGLSALVGAFYVWAVGLAAHEDPLLAVPAAGAYAVWGACTLLSVVLLWWHQERPVAVFAAVFALHLAGSIAVGNGGLGGVALPLWFAVYAVAAFAAPAASAALVAGAWAVATAVQLMLASAAGLVLSAPQAIVAAVGQGFFFLACFVIGHALRAGRVRAQDAAERAAMAQARSRAEAAEAVSRERNRMARDLHDIAAHQLMDVLLTTRAALLSAPDPLLQEIERKTAEAFGSIRSVVGALRESDADEPTGEALARAVARVVERLGRERGIRVVHRAEVSHEPPPAVTSTAVSVLTEALVNAATHAPGAPVTVALDSDATALHREVRNPVARPGALPGAGGSGYGLVGAAERAHVLRGSLVSGVGLDGDWAVTLELPVPSPATEAIR